MTVETFKQKARITRYQFDPPEFDLVLANEATLTVRGLPIDPHWEYVVHGGTLPEFEVELTRVTDEPLGGMEAPTHG